jgi:hypothetical protein
MTTSRREGADPVAEAGATEVTDTTSTTTPAKRSSGGRRVS